MLGDTPDEIYAFYLAFGLGILIGLQIMFLLLVYWIKIRKESFKRWYKNL